MGISMEAQKEAILEKSKKTMSVPEMRRLLGLKKTDGYWLVHRIKICYLHFILCYKYFL